MTPNDIFAAVRKLQEDDMALGDMNFHGSMAVLHSMRMVLKLVKKDPRGNHTRKGHAERRPHQGGCRRKVHIPSDSGIATAPAQTGAFLRPQPPPFGYAVAASVSVNT